MRSYKEAKQVTDALGGITLHASLQLVPYDNDDYGICVMYHSTDIVVYFPDGSVVLDSGGWRTQTTMQWMNEYLPLGWSVHKTKKQDIHNIENAGVWYLRRGVLTEHPGEKEYIFHDGIRIGPRGGCDGKVRVVK